MAQPIRAEPASSMAAFRHDAAEVERIVSRCRSKWRHGAWLKNGLVLERQ
jgi:hypothetical protein